MSSCTPTCSYTVEGDTWTFNGTWAGHLPTSTPSPRVLYRAAYDPNAGGVVLFAGETDDPGKLFNDTWVWTGSSWNQAVGVASPPGRELFGMAYDTAANQMVVVGGDGPLTLPTDTWAYNWFAPTLTESSSATPVANGEAVQFTVNVGNPNPTSKITGTLNDVLSAGLSLGALFQPTSITDQDGGTFTCATLGCTATTVAGVTTLVFKNLALVAGDVITVVYQVLAAASQVACNALTHSGQALNGALAGTTEVLAVDLCGGGLGLESWWSYRQSDLGSGGTASVNVADGNLVVQQEDSTPIQGHGRIGYALRRSYNSEDTTLVPGSTSIGAGWQLNVAQTNDLGTGGVTPLGLTVPSLLSLLNPLAVTLVDRDGTRHVFSWNGYQGPLQAPPTTSATAPLLGYLKALSGQATAVQNSINTLCLGTGYTPPAGVDMNMWSYVGVSGTCAAPGGVEVPLGFSVERSDRVHYDFAAGGETVDMVDGSGNVQLYTYSTNPVQLTSISEPSCTAGGLCRATTFTYSANETNVTDPAGRTTEYFTDASHHLTKVVNPDLSSELYTYGGCGGTANEMCSATDPRGDVTRFTYTANVIPVLPGAISSVVDRRALTTNFSYTTVNAAPATVAQQIPAGKNCIATPSPCEQTLYSNIDANGRVSETDQGYPTSATAATYVKMTTDSWDSFGTHGTGAAKVVCTVPAPPLPSTFVDGLPVDNNLCSQTIHAVGGYAPDQVSTYTYGAQGQTLTKTETVAAGQTATTTWGYHIQNVEASGTVSCLDYTPTGSGAVSTTATACQANPDSSTLYSLSDQTATVTARGNAANPPGGYRAYETTDKVDDTAGLPNKTQPGSCGAATAANTGNVCETDAPATNGTAASPAGTGNTVTRYSYDSYGQKGSMTSPKSVAEDGAAVSTTYSYYADSDTDLSGLVSAGGWLKTVTDPKGNFVAFAYDRAGDQVRSWDRDATAGHHQSDAWNTQPPAMAPSTAFTETLYGPYPNAPAGSTPYSAPWRWELSTRDPLGDLTSYTVDANGNRTSIRPPLGNQAGNNSRDVIQGFDAADDLTWTLQPVQAGPAGPPAPPTIPSPPPPANSTIYGYDSFGNRTAQSDPDGNVQTWSYDSANRQIGHAFTRGPSNTAYPPPACRASTAGDAPIPTGKLLCSTATFYNGVDDVIETSDGNAQVTGFNFAGLGRKIEQTVPRSTDATTHVVTYVVTEWNYDADGHIIDTCPPDEFTVGGSTNCTATGVYSNHVAYNAAGLAVSSTTYRQAGSADTTTTGYDADGNPISVTDADQHTTTAEYDLLDRKIELDTPRAAGQTNATTWTYDPSGNVITLVEPPSGTTVHQTAYSYDADNRPLDTVVGADNPVAAAAGLPDNAGTVNARTRKVYDADGNLTITYSPRAFLPYGSQSTIAQVLAAPNPDYATTVSYDNDDRPVTSQAPRYDTADPTVTPVDNEATQNRQCPTGAPGIAHYPATTGVCTTAAVYDNDGRVIELKPPTVVDSPNRNIQYSYTDDGLVSAVNTPDASHDGNRLNATSTSYDGDGKPDVVTDALGTPVVTVYTNDELVSQVLGPYYTDGSNNVTHQTFNTYDADGNKIQTVDGLGQTTTTTYTADNLTATTCQSLTLKTACNLTGTPKVDGLQTGYTYDPAGNPTQVLSPSGSDKDPTNPSGTATVNTYTYDNLLLTATVPAAGDGSKLRATSCSYDAGGRKTSQTTNLTAATGTIIQNGGTQSFTYAPDDQPVTQTGRTGETVTTSYNPDGQPTGYTDNGATAVANLTATYYLDGTLRSVDDTARTTSYAYDGLGDPTALTETNDPGLPAASHTTTYTYGDDAQPETITSDLTGATPWTLTYTKDDQPTSQSDPNGQTVATSYYPDNTLSNQTTTGAQGAALANWTYHYDSDGRVTTQTLTNAAGPGPVTVAGTYSYGYDPAGRIDSFTDQTATRAVTFDHDNNRLTYGNQTFTYNPDDTINTGPAGANNTTATYNYDGAGRLTNDGCNTYTYDGFDHILTAAGTTNRCTGTTTYTYNGAGQQQSAGGTNLHHDGLNQTAIAEAPTATPNSDNAYVLAPDATPLANITPTGAASYLTSDGHGNITTTTNLAQTVTCEARFDPFGTPENVGTADKTIQNTCNTGTTANTAFYQASRHEPTTGDYQFGARTYDPTKNSFLTPDTPQTPTSPAAISVGTDPLTRNTYTYVNGDPINYTDPTGHVPCVDQVCGSVKFLDSQTGMAAITAREKGEQQALAQLSQQTASLYPGSHLVEGNQGLLLDNGTVVSLTTALSVAQNPASVVAGQQLGGQLLEQQITSCIQTNADYGASTVRISVDPSASPYNNVNCTFGTPPAPPTFIKDLNYVAGFSSVVSTGLGDIATACILLGQLECTGPVKVASTVAGGVSIAASIGVTSYICANGTDAQCSNAEKQTIASVGLTGVAIFASPDATKMVRTFEGLGASLVGTSISALGSRDTSKVLQDIANSTPVNPAPGQIACVNRGDAVNVCAGSIG